MNDFEYGLPVAWLVEFTESLNESLDFKKFDVTLDSLNLKTSMNCLWIRVGVNTFKNSSFS